MGSKRSTPSITAAAIKRAPLRSAAYFLTDGTGLAVRVAPSGHKSFRYQIRSLGRVITIGEWAEGSAPGFVTLAEARVWLERLRGAHKAGKLAEVEAELDAAMKPKAPEPAAAGTTFESVAKEYVDHIKRLGWKTADEVERTLKKDVLGHLGPRPVNAIDAKEVRSVVKRVAARAPTQAGHVFDYVSAVLRHAVGNAEIVTNVADALDPVALGCVERTSQRFLDDAEIIGFWRGLDRSKVSPTVRAGLRLLLLTGLRSGELIGATVDDLDLAAKTLSVPPDRQKLKPKSRAEARPFVVPLSPQAMVQVERLRVLGEGSRYLLASPVATNDDEDAPISEKALIAGMRTLYEPKPNKSGKKREAILAYEGDRPTPHDLRRTLRTGLGRLRVPPHVAERCLNHKLGGIAAVYDVHDYLDERREALDKWGAHVERLLVGDAGNVVALPAVRS